MPSIQAKLINVVLHVLRMKRTVNRMRERVENGDRTYTEPSRRLNRKHRISKEKSTVTSYGPSRRKKTRARSMSSICTAVRMSTASRHSIGR